MVDVNAHGAALRAYTARALQEDEVISLGVDGCKAGWFAISLSTRNDSEFDVFDSVGSLWNRWGQKSDICLVDIPIGLAEADASRPCDTLARQLLGVRASSVFNPPVRSALDASTWSEAADENERKTGKRITVQTWHIIPKIRQVDQFLCSTPAARGIVREAHPEVLFHLMNDRSPLHNKKSRSAGITERLDILESIYPDSRSIAKRAFELFPRRMVKKDDVIDALACAVVGLLWKGRLDSLPRKPGTDSRGLPMEMVLPDFAQPEWAA